MTAEDITENYVDSKARLDNARSLEKRLLQLLENRSAKLADVVLVEEKLSEARGQIEQYESKLRYYDRFIALSTLIIEVSVEESYKPAVRHTFWHRASLVWANSLSALGDFSQALMLAAIAFLPWSVPAAIVAFGFAFALRRIHQRKRNASPAT